MNNASENLLSAVDILVEEALSKLQYDKTIQATIYSIVNLDAGEYKVRYSGNVFSAFATDLKVQYKVNDYVYVIVPEGNFSNKKMIHSKISQQSLSYGQMISLTNSISETSPHFDVMYNDDWSAAVGVVAGAPQDDPLSHSTIFEATKEDYHDLFRQYSSSNNLIRIKASFMTQLHCEHTEGNYGIKIEFFTKGEDIVSYTLDLNSFNGNPYSLSVYSPQFVIINTQPGFLTGIKSIQLFEENFIYDRYVEYGLVTDKENQTVPNIFVKDIEISFVEQKNLTDNLYYLDIATPRGSAFTKDITSLDLVAKLVYEGENILSESSCECKWFKRDLSVMIGGNSYDKNAGIGWFPVTPTVFDTMTLTAEDVIHQQEYKLVVIYNDEVIMTDVETVYNLQSPYDFELRQATVGDEIQLQLVNNKNNEVLLGNWYLSYPDGSYSFVAEGQNSINVTDFLLYSSVVFYCEVIADGEVLGVLEHTITSSDSEDDITISYVGEDQFRYDANGDIAIEDAEKERTLQVSLAWKDGVGTSYTVEWISPDGGQITNTRQNPDQSMIENLWVDNNNILHYTIKQKYKVNFNNNSIIVKIITVDGKEYEFRKEILFLKDGDQGTNGTTYVTAIRPCNADGVKLSGLQPLIYRNGWVNSLQLRCYVYKDGEPINDNPNYDISYKWAGENVTTGEDGDRLTVRGQAQIISAAASPYVKVQVTINDRMNNRSYDIYSFYPIDVSVGFSNEEIDNISIDNIPSYIKYTSSGVNPSFYSNNIQFLYNNIDYSYYISSLTQDILNIEEDDGLYYLKPASSFVFENNSMALLRCQYTNAKYLLHPVIMYLDTYGNEAINGWDGTKLDINEDDGHIFAPQIGAGKKDSANRFTGVVMGQDSGQKLIGLYGYQAGVNTFGLTEDGKAFFGAKTGGGQILIDGTSATIQGGGGGDSSNGMTITLASKANTDNAIKIGAGKFRVTYEGKLYATGADIEGVIKAVTGYIGGRDGWTIDTYRIYSGSGTNYVELNSNRTRNTDNTFVEPYAIWCGSASSVSAASSKFAVSKEGKLYAKEGNIGGWTMTSKYLQDAGGTVGMASSGTAAFWAGSGLNADSSSIGTANSETKFLVTRSGKMYCSSADIRGKITADSGNIGGWTISATSLKGGSTYLYSSGRIVCEDASITGTINATTLSCNSGNIGGWTISSNGLKNGSTTLNSSGLTTEEINIYNGSMALGTLGLVYGHDGVQTTYNVGIDSANAQRSVIISSKRNIALRATYEIWVSGTAIHFDGIPKTSQHGIYAQFA